MQPLPLLFVTGNNDKVAETQLALGTVVHLERISLTIDEIQSMDAAEVCRKKALAAYEQVKKPLIVDDVGFYIDCWNGFPGVFIAHLKKAGEMKLLLQMMETFTNRKATARACVGYHDGTQVYIFEGSVSGTLTRTERGTDGWGFDTIFIPDGYEKTMAELGLAVKSRISHRAQALGKLRDFLHT